MKVKIIPAIFLFMGSYFPLSVILLFFSVIPATPTLRRHLSAQIKQLDENVKDASDGVSIGGFRPKSRLSGSHRKSGAVSGRDQ